MALKLYNTLTRTKEEFHPLDTKNVRMYVCGPTVYDFAHIGNARPVIVFDVLFRLLRHIYGDTHVTYVRNITDVDDKINARAAAEGVSIREVTERTAKQYFEDVAALGALPPTHQPRATEYVRQMIAMIEKLIASGHAYPAEGHVLYDVSSKADYGKLARRSLDEMIAGARVEVAPYKKNPMDFVLWKPSKQGEPSWPSPWSDGRPGWHIECSAMSEALLGETFDIHGGGIDLVFPHHENEIAQSEAAHPGHPFARVWMHNGFLQVEGEKMSKSLGNFITIRELLTGWRGHPWRGAAIRLAMLGSHYRQPIDWTFDRLSEAQADLDRFFKVWKNMIQHPSHTGSIRAIPSEKLVDALSDDLNVPDALAEIRTRRAEIFAGGDRGRDVYQKSQSLISDLFFLGVLDEHTLNTLDDAYLKNLSSLPATADDIKKLKDFAVYVANNDVQSQRSATATLTLSGFKIAVLPSGVVDVEYAGTSSETVQQLIEKRNAARAVRDFKESDRIRDELAAKGIVLKDGPSGTTWEVKR